MLDLLTNLAGRPGSATPVGGAGGRVQRPGDGPDDGLVVGPGHGLRVGAVQLAAGHAAVHHGAAHAAAALATPVPGVVRVRALQKGIHRTLATVAP